MKVLLVDDSKFVRFSVKKLLVKSLENDTEYFEAGTGTEGLKECSRVIPDLIFLDLIMPDMNGEEVLEEIRKSNQKVFIVILTSNYQKTIHDRLVASGANMFIPKTISPEKIEEVLTAYQNAN